MKYIKEIDFLSQKVSLTINNEGDKSFKTLFGGLISFLTFFVSIFCGTYFLIRLFKRRDMTVIHSTFTDSFVNITNSHQLPFLLRLSDTNSLPYENDEKIYYITSSVWFGGSNDSSLIGTASQYSQKLNISKCDLNIHFSDEYKSYFQNFKNLTTYYCINPRNYSQTIYGLYGNSYPFSYYSFTLRYCLNTTENNNSCYSISDIKNYIKSPYLDVIFIDYNIDSLNHNDVKKIDLRKERYELSILLYKRIWLYFENIKYITDKGYIFTSKQKENFFRYHSVRIDPSLLEGEKSYFSTLTILNSINTSIYYKEYKKFQDYIAIIGGLVKIVTLVGTFLNYFYSMNTYYLKIINDFIIENKIVEKNNKKQYLHQNSSMVIFPKFKNNFNNEISKNDSGINHNFTNNIHLVKIESFLKINSSISNKIFPIQFSNKETKDIFLFYKELVNQRLNIINILKKLEVIQIPDLKKCFSNNTNRNLKLINTQYNNYTNEN
jgi:hypothetical protein